MFKPNYILTEACLIYLNKSSGNGANSFKNISNLMHSSIANLDIREMSQHSSISCSEIIPNIHLSMHPSKLYPVQGVIRSSDSLNFLLITAITTQNDGTSQTSAVFGAEHKQRCHSQLIEKAVLFHRRLHCCILS